MRIIDIIEHAREFATQAHAGQMYGGERPYECHLEDVVSTLRTFGVTDESILAAAWLHDVVEDTGVSIDVIREKFGAEVAALVQAVTSEPGQNRKQRNKATYPKIRVLDGARLIKLADRVSNVGNAWTSRNPLLFMYHNEYPEFRSALRLADVRSGIEKMLWDKLNGLHGWRA